jgi:hypothetical protein
VDQLRVGAFEAAGQPIAGGLQILLDGVGLVGQ